MLRRRGMMAAAAAPAPEWDVEWDGTSGSEPTAQGFNKTTSGTASVAMGSVSAKVTVKGSGSYCNYNYPSDASIGVLEAVVGVFTTGGFIFVKLGNGTHEISVALYVNSSYQGIYLRNSTTQANRTKLTNASVNTRYTIRLVLRANDADVYVDGVLVAQNVDLSTIPYNSNEKSVAAHTSINSNTQDNLYSIKLKLGRTS